MKRFPGDTAAQCFPLSPLARTQMFCAARLIPESWHSTKLPRFQFPWSYARRALWPTKNLRRHP